MITRIEALWFRSLRYVAQDVRRFHVLVGPNGAGKSTFLDVVGFLGDMLRVGPLRAILGDAASGVPTRAADPSHLAWMRSAQHFELVLELTIPASLRAGPSNGKRKRARYEVAVQVGGSGEVSLLGETLWLIEEREKANPPQQKRLFPEPVEAPGQIILPANKRAPSGWRKVVSKIGESGNDYFYAETSKWGTQFRLGASKSALANLPEDETKFPVATWVKRTLMSGVQRVVLNAEAMRSPSPPGAPRVFLPDGSNLPWVVEHLRETDAARYKSWVDHVRTALSDVQDVTTIERPEDKHRYLVLEYRNGLKAPSWVVSDGTLRLLALTLIAYVPNRQGTFLIEEPENGIHPRAVETVFQSLSSVYEAQVLCASHSPVILKLACPEDLLCFAKTEDGSTDIVAGSEHPRIRSWQGEMDLGTLFAAGVLG